MNEWAHVFSPISLIVSGTCAATGAHWLSQQLVLTHPLKLYTCANAIRLFSGSLGRCASHCAMLLDQVSPPTMITFVAPVARTALTRLWNPATGKPMPGQVPPSWKQVQPASTLFAGMSGNGSLNRSRTTASLPLNAFATPVQNRDAFWASGIGFWQRAIASEQLAPAPPYAPKLQCSSTIGVIPLLINRLT